MAQRKIRVLVIGAAGVTARVCVCAMAERDVEIVAATGNRRHIGEDIGEIAGCGKLGVALSPRDELEALIKSTTPDIAFDMTLNTIAGIYDNAKLCLSHGVDFVSVGEQCYAPFLTDPEMAAELDAIAKANDATFLASGSGDVWQLLPALGTACSASIKKITWEFWALTDDFGEAVMRDVGIGEPEENWGPYLQMDGAPAAELTMRQLVRQLGLEETSVERRVEAIPAPCDLEYPQAGVVVRQGQLLGHRESALIRTAEGIDVEGIIHVKNSEPGETNALVATIEGEPNLSIRIDDFHGDISTSTIMVNRIPDVVAAPAGVLTANDLPMVTYKPASAFFIQ